MDRWWANCIRNKRTREWIGERIRNVRSRSNGYVFTRDMYKKALEEEPFEEADSHNDSSDDESEAEAAQESDSDKVEGLVNHSASP
jgi:hypothetical protein